MSARAILCLSVQADAEVIQRGHLRVNFDGELTPRTLPRHGSAPVRVSVATKIASTNGGNPPQLRTIAIAVNRFGRFNPDALPQCTVREIQPATTENALRECGDSLVGVGSFSARVLLKQQAPFPAAGKLYAFNGVYRGKPAILAHVYGTDPVPTSFTFPFVVEQGPGTFGTVLRTSFPGVAGDAGYITSLSLNLGRSLRAHGRTQSFLTASCPAPAGFPGATFPFVKASMGFGRRTLTSTLTRSCKARGR
jgi:hypothetical protein